MAITNYTELQTAVAAWMQRTDLTSIIPDFIGNAEAEFNRTLRLTGALTRADLAVASGDRWTDLTTLTIPLAQIRSVSITTGGRRFALEYLAPDASQPLYTEAEPRWYTRSGDELGVFPPPVDDYTLELIYWRTLPDLATNSTNYLLTLAPDLYLYRAVLEGAHYTRDADLAGRVDQMYQRAMVQLANDDKRRQFGGSALQVRAA